MANNGLPPGATLVSGTVPDVADATDSQSSTAGRLPPGATLVSGTVPPAPPAPGTTGIAGAANKVGEFGAGFGEGAIQSMSESIHNLPWIGKKILSPEAMEAEREYFKPGSEAEKHGQTTGDIAEPILEFVLMDGALKAVSIGEKVGIAGKIAKIAQDSPYIGKLLQHGVNAARMGTVGAAEAKLKGASNADALKAGAVAGIGGEALPAIGSTMEKVAPAAYDAVSSVATRLTNPFKKLIQSQIASPVEAGEAVSQPLAQAGVKATAPTVGPSFRSGIDIEKPLSAAKKTYQVVDDAAKTDFKVLYEKMDAAQDAARVAAPGSPEEAVAQKNIEATQASINEHKNIAEKSGVPNVDKLLAQADAKFAETQANKDFNTKFFGNQSVISGNVVHGIPEKIDVDAAITTLENFDKPNKFGVSRLQMTSLGKDGALKLKQVLYDAQKAGQQTLNSRALRNTILKLLAGGGGLIEGARLATK